MYQALKTIDQDEREAIAALKTPSQAKEAGQKVKKRENWDKLKFLMMKEVLRLKFKQNPDLKQKLLDTGELYLEETNSWQDVCWGVCNGVGKNHLGRLLMEIRDEFKNT